MRNGVHWIGALVLSGILLVILLGWIAGRPEGRAVAAEAPRTFTIRLPAGLFPDLSRPAVEFDHGLHTLAMEGEACEACHREEKGALRFALVEFGPDATAGGVTDAWHRACGECHEDRGTGPEACGECHDDDGAPAPWPVIELDLRSHDAHVEHFERKCDGCHHVEDEATGELVWREGEETTCRDCHRDGGPDEPPAYREVAHERCVNCHRTEGRAGRETGPFDCAGCHDPGRAPDPLADMTGVPRLAAGQPDEPVLGVEGSRMKDVLFDHRNHETRARNCRVCHHESVRPCRDCHTLEGSPEGRGLKLADAFHHPRSVHSCVGCHERRKETPACAVCHGAMPPGPADASCDVCHAGSEPEQVVAARHERDPALLLPVDLEEEFTIGSLADRYEPVTFPHAKIVKTLNFLLGDDRLANVFHGDRTVVCTACHHHSPLGQDPPNCSRCHQDPFDVRILHRPGLKGAYHQQCIGCHKELEYLGDWRDCAGCHRDAAPMPGHPEGAAAEGGGR